MSTSWQLGTVNDLVSSGEAEVRTGPFGTQLHASDYVEEGTPVINVRNIGLGGIRKGKLEFISDETVQRLSTHLLRPGDIVFGRKGAVERHAFVDSKHANWFQGSDCIRLRVKSPSVDTKFLSYSFLTEPHKLWMMNQCSHGATMASLNQEIINRIPLNLPPLPTQHKIAAVLTAYDDLIENNLRRIEILEEVARAIYREWFVHFRFPGHEKVGMVDSELGPLPEGWEATQLGEVARQVRRNVKPDQVDPGTPYVGLEHIPRRSIALSDWSIVDDVQSSKLSFERSEILFSKIRPYFHKVAVAPMDGVCSSDTIVISSRAARHFSLVLSLVSSEEFVNHATQTSQGTKMPRADWNVLVEYPVALPPFSLLQRFDEFIRDIVSQIQNLVFRSRNLRRTRDLLLPKLISGELSAEELDIGGDELNGS